MIAQILLMKEPSQEGLNMLIVLNKIWKVLTYKWQLQILFNLPFLIWWLLDVYLVKVHEFDLKLLSYLNLPDWALSLIGFGQSSS